MASTSVSSDSEPKLTEIEQKILNFAQEKQSGISNKDILELVPSLQPTDIAQIINKLIKHGYVYNLLLK